MFLFLFLFSHSGNCILHNSNQHVDFYCIVETHIRLRFYLVNPSFGYMAGPNMWREYEVSIQMFLFSHSTRVYIGLRDVIISADLNFSWCCGRKKIIGKSIAISHHPLWLYLQTFCNCYSLKLFQQSFRLTNL